jgi:hypothetical protein
VAVTCVYLVEPVGCCATGVVHGPAGTGKTYAVQAALETLARDSSSSSSGVRVTACTLAFPARPTMRLVADELLRAITGSPGPRSSNWFYLIATLTARGYWLQVGAKAPICSPRLTKPSAAPYREWNILGEAGPRAAWIRCSGLSQATTPVAPAT